jgi:hypothetical protein
MTVKNDVEYLLSQIEELVFHDPDPLVRYANLDEVAEALTGWLAVLRGRIYYDAHDVRTLTQVAELFGLSPDTVIDGQRLYRKTRNRPLLTPHHPMRGLTSARSLVPDSE